MGYPFDKTWNNRKNSTASVREIIKDLPHVMITDFTIYRSTELYEGCTFDNVTQSMQNITWENTINFFFTADDINCMKWMFDLGKKDCVQENAVIIYAAVKYGNMPKGKKAWNQTKVDSFKRWICSGFP